MFLGEYQHTLDPKGRVSLPRRYRDVTGGTVVVTKGFEKALVVYTVDGYEAFLAERFTGRNLTKAVRKMQRHFIAGAAWVDIDAAGRISLPGHLRAFANLQKDVIVAGLGDHMEIWDAAAWRAFESENEPTIEEAAEELARQGNR